MKRIITTTIYILAVLLSIAMFILYQNYTVLVLTVFLIIMPVISISLGVYAAKKINLKIETVNEAIDSNQEFNIEFVISNPTVVPVVDYNISASYKNNYYDFEEELLVSVPVYALGEQRVVVPVKSRYVGVFDVQVNSVTVWDIMHFVRNTQVIDYDKRIELYPIVNGNMLFDANTYGTGDDDSQESNRKGSDFSEVRDIREYIPGDSLKDIHWKLSVKKDILMVKEHESMSTKRVAILMEITNGEQYELNSIVELSYSLARNLIDVKIPFTLYWWSESSNALKEREIITIDDVESNFVEIFYEKPYVDNDKGLKELPNVVSGIEYIIWVNREEQTSGELLMNYKGAYVHYVMV